MKRVLVTGANGFVGRHCLPLLVERAEEVHAVTSTGRMSGPATVRWHSADLLRFEQTGSLLRQIQPTHLLHLAWYTQPASFWQAPANFQWLEASLVLLREFVRWQGERVLTAGTCAEYEWSDGVCRESSTPIRPATPYGRCKAALFWASEALAQTRQVSSAWARFFFLYGPGAPPQKFPAAVYHALFAGQTAKCTAGRQQRDFLFVRDAADALVRLLESDLRGPVNVASGVPRRVADMAHGVACLMGKEHLLQLGALPTRAHEPPLLVADVTRLREELGWAPRVPFDQGLAECLEELEPNSSTRCAA